MSVDFEIKIKIIIMGYWEVNYNESYVSKFGNALITFLQQNP